MPAARLDILYDALAGLAFLGGGVVGVALSKKVRAPWGAAALAVVGWVVFLWVCQAVPFRGVWTEVLVSAAAAVAMVPSFVAAGDLFQRAVRPAVPFVILLTLPGVMMPLTCRATYAPKLHWSVDGTVSSKYRKNNPALVVRTDHGDVTLYGVDEGLWGSASVGSRLEKPAPSAFGRLDGRPVRVVPRAMPWRHEPGGAGDTGGSAR